MLALGLIVVGDDGVLDSATRFGAYPALNRGTGDALRHERDAAGGDGVFFREGENFGEVVRGITDEFEIRRGREIEKLKFELGKAQSAAYRVEEIPDASAAQRQLRKEWLTGKTER